MRQVCIFALAQVENEQLLDHEARRLGEHLYMLLSFVLSLRPEAGKVQPLSSAEAGSALLGGHPLVSEAELPSSVGLLGRCEALERKTVTFENIVCVLNREVERVSLTAEAHSRQHQADQEKIEALSGKVRGHPWRRAAALPALALGCQGRCTVGPGKFGRRKGHRTARLDHSGARGDGARPWLVQAGFTVSLVLASLQVRMVGNGSHVLSLAFKGAVRAFGEREGRVPG